MVERFPTWDWDETTVGGRIVQTPVDPIPQISMLLVFTKATNKIKPLRMDMETEHSNRGPGGSRG